MTRMGSCADTRTKNVEITSYVNDSRGNVTSVTNPSGLVTNMVYFPASITDKRSDLVQTVTMPRGGVTTYAYDQYGNLSTQTDAAGLVKTVVNSTGTEGAVGGGTVPPGLVLSLTLPNGEVTSFGYNSKGDLVQRVAPGGLVTTFETDGLGRTTSETATPNDGPSITSTIVYTPLGLPDTVDNHQ